MIRRPPRSTLDRSSAASDVYKRQASLVEAVFRNAQRRWFGVLFWFCVLGPFGALLYRLSVLAAEQDADIMPVSYTHLRAHETVLDLVCRLLLEKKKTRKKKKKQKYKKKKENKQYVLM